MKKSILLLAAIGLLVSVSAATVEIINDTGGYDIYYIYMSPSWDDSWGDDWLGSDILYSGNSFSFNVPDDNYDIRLVDEDGDEYIRYGVDVDGYYGWNVTLADLGEYDYSSSSGYSGGDTVYGDAPVTIYNDTGGYDIWYIYANPSSYTEWGEDRLGSEILYSGNEYTFWVEGGDYYDIQCEDEDGDTYTFWEMWVGDDGLYLPVDLGDLD